jgi:hypothetical protein
LRSVFYIERSRYEKNPHLSDYFDGGLGKHHGAWMSHVAAACTSGSAAATTAAGSGQIEVRMFQVECQPH